MEPIMLVLNKVRNRLWKLQDLLFLINKINKKGRLEKPMKFNNRNKTNDFNRIVFNLNKEMVGHPRMI